MGALLGIKQLEHQFAGLDAAALAFQRPVSRQGLSAYLPIHSHKRKISPTTAEVVQCLLEPAGRASGTGVHASINQLFPHGGRNCNDPMKAWALHVAADVDLPGCLFGQLAHRAAVPVASGDGYRHAVVCFTARVSGVVAVTALDDEHPGCDGQDCRTK